MRTPAEWLRENYNDFMRSQDRYYGEFIKDHGLEDVDGASNAVAHAHTSAVYTYYFGETAAELMGDFKETRIFTGNDNDGPDSAKDQFNNEVGREIGARVFSEGYSVDRIDTEIEFALKNGALVTDTSDPRLELPTGGTSGAGDYSDGGTLSVYEDSFGNIGSESGYGHDGSNTSDSSSGGVSGGWSGGDGSSSSPGSDSSGLDIDSGGMETTPYDTSTGEWGPTEIDDKGPHQIGPGGGGDGFWGGGGGGGSSGGGSSSDDDDIIDNL